MSAGCITSYYKRFNTGKGEILPGVGCNQLPFRLTLFVVTMHTFWDKNHSLFIRMESPHTPKTILMSQYSCTKASRLTLTCKEDPNTAGKGDHFNFLCCKHIHILFFSPNCLQLGVHFAMRGSLPLVPLASYEGSGNTWARYLIEQLTGLFTGDMYCVRQSIKCEMTFGTDIFSLHSNPGGKLGTRVRWEWKRMQLPRWFHLHV